jgi:hypothetical protein
MDYMLPLKRHLLRCYIYRTDSLRTTGFRQTLCISQLDKQHNTSDHHWLRKSVALDSDLVVVVVLMIETK